MINPKRLGAFLCLLLLPVLVRAQDTIIASAVLSKPTDLPLKGWNRVLLLHDGRTMVLHLAPWEKMVVKVFDTAHSEVASTKQLFKMISESQLDNAAFKGFYEINGIPTLFIMQQIENKNALFRITFNPDNGALVSEVVQCESPNKQHQEDYYVSKSPVGDDYAVLHLQHLVVSHKSHVYCTIWNKQHQKIKTAVFPMPGKEVQETHYMGMLHHTAYGTYAAVAYMMETGIDKWNSYVLTVSLQPEDTTFRSYTVDFGQKQMPWYGFLQYNAFAESVNLGVSSYVRFNLKNGLYGIGTTNHLIVLDKYLSEVKALKELSANLKNEDTIPGHARFDRLPVRMYTNKYGSTALFTESLHYGNNYDITKGGRVNMTTFGEVCYRKLDDLGEEVSGNIFPKMQQVLNNMAPAELAMRGTTKYLFRDYQDQDYSNQFTSFECLQVRNFNYLFINDNPTNRSKKPGEFVDPTRDFSWAEAICYRISPKEEVQWQYLFGTPAPDESHALLIESIDYQPEQKKFSGLVGVRKGKEQHLRVAWCTLQ